MQISCRLKYFLIQICLVLLLTLLFYLILTLWTICEEYSDRRREKEMSARHLSDNISRLRGGEIQDEESNRSTRRSEKNILQDESIKGMLIQVRTSFLEEEEGQQNLREPRITSFEENASCTSNKDQGTESKIIKQKSTEKKCASKESPPAYGKASPSKIVALEATETQSVKAGTTSEPIGREVFSKETIPQQNKITLQPNERYLSKDETKAKLINTKTLKDRTTPEPSAINATGDVTPIQPSERISTRDGSMQNLDEKLILKEKTTKNWSEINNFKDRFTSKTESDVVDEDSIEDVSQTFIKITSLQTRSPISSQIKTNLQIPSSRPDAFAVRTRAGAGNTTAADEVKIDENITEVKDLKNSEDPTTSKQGKYAGSKRDAPDIVVDKLNTLVLVDENGKFVECFQFRESDYYKALEEFSFADKFKQEKKE